MRGSLSLILVLLCNGLVAQTTISPTEAKKHLDQNKKIQLIDVRTPEEYESGHIGKAKLINWKDKERFKKEVKKLNKKRPVYLYCKSGNRSSQAADYLASIGYQVYDMEGGITNWEKQELDIEISEMIYHNLTMGQLEEIIRNDKIVLLDFYADWCGPCKQMDPALNRIKKEMKDSVAVVKINVDYNSTLAKELGITKIPVISVFKNNKRIWSHVGYADEKTLRSQLN